ncbi:MAG: hypothetical protein F4Y27_10840 [Acidimicrobiaceae bacterium]|nr:hypothetical protein [Acidimicrobiaceae bacterium]MYA75162.1 hypothetical protein [Acidimicrobiaceae bacterium]MYD07237.1 hypothetical protein [Acidimicrobiaceae bacterium]MYG56681.1 hypothetical protein [Acidimicrobiaceae bacterium]MYH87831.1 hypothetical protein [Acidimicrobiaceae bacterium]
MSGQAGQVNPDQTLTVATTASVVSDLHWASTSLFELFVFWASEVEPDHGDIASWLSSTGHHLGEQAQNLKGLMPDSVLLADLTDFASPSPQAEEALGAVRAIPGSVMRLAIAHRVLLAQLSNACESLQQLAKPHADAPLLRAIGFLLLDLGNDREQAELLLGSSHDPDVSQQVDRAVMEAKSHLASAGGLVPGIVLY